jgi:hypothetical protein
MCTDRICDVQVPCNCQQCHLQFAAAGPRTASTPFLLKSQQVVHVKLGWAILPAANLQA